MLKEYENFALFITVAANDSKQSHSVVGNCLHDYIWEKLQLLIWIHVDYMYMPDWSFDNMYIRLSYYSLHWRW